MADPKDAAEAFKRVAQGVGMDLFKRGMVVVAKAAAAGYNSVLEDVEDTLGKAAETLKQKRQRVDVKARKVEDR